MKKIVALTMALVLIALCLPFSAGAALPPVDFGDVNRDYSVDVLDATLIQRHLADISVFSYEDELRADFDRDGEVTVLDVTYIQRKEAEIPIPDTCGGEGYADVDVTSFYADYDSGKATPNVPVTFTARANCGEKGATYEFFIDGELVRERSEDNSFTYTFTHGGDYDVTVRAYNKYGFRTTSKIWQFYSEYPSETCYKVADSYPSDELTLSGVSWIDYMYTYSPSVEIHAAGGTAPYTYSYIITDIDSQYVQDADGWTVITDENERTCMYHDFTEENVMTIPFDMLEPRSSHDLIIQAKDANGDLSETRTLYFDTGDIIIG